MGRRQVYDPSRGSVSKWGAFLDDVAGFDADFFGINERGAIADRSAAPLACCETSWEAMDHAGLTRETMADSLTGVCVGLSHGNYQLLMSWRGRMALPADGVSVTREKIAYAVGSCTVRAHGGHRMFVWS